MKYISRLTHHKFFLPIALIFGPMVFVMLLWLLGMATWTLTGAPGFLDELPQTATPLQRFGYSFIGVIFLLVVVCWYFIIPAGIIIGISLLLWRLFKKGLTHAEN